MSLLFSEKWGESIKSIVRGGGGLEFFVDRTCLGDENDNALMPMQLLLMTEHGCEADAEFWIMTENLDCGPQCSGRVTGGLLYRAKILITQTGNKPAAYRSGGRYSQFRQPMRSTEEVRLITD